MTTAPMSSEEREAVERALTALDVASCCPECGRIEPHVEALRDAARRYLALTAPGEPDAGSCEEAHGEHFAGMCTSCGGDVYHRPGKLGEYDHECTSGEPAEGPGGEARNG